MASVFEDLEFRGLVSQQTAGLPALLDAGGLTVYHGIDPSADSLHVGHLIGVLTLRRLQEGGHRPIALAGGGTGQIGDPGGKDTERPLLGIDQIAANVAGIRAQLEGLLEFSSSLDQGALLLDNAEWLGAYRLVDFLREVGKHFTVNQMVAKESVKSRIERPEQGISFTEFSYMLLQATDYLHLFDHYGCRLQIGGSDQWGNITMGIDYIRRARQQEAHGLTWPLLTRSDGSKVGKSDSGEVPWLDRRRTSPFSLYQYFVRKPDDEVGQLLRYLTFLSKDEITALDEERAEHPERRQSQQALARQVCTLVHGKDETARAEAAAAALYSEEIADLDEELLLEVFSKAPSSSIERSALDGEGLALDEALARTGLSASKGAARTAISQGGAYVNNRRRREDDARIKEADLLYGRYVVLRRGRREYHLVLFE
jgi:tyrosyl-tRNA synthetase